MEALLKLEVYEFWIKKFWSEKFWN